MSIFRVLQTPVTSAPIDLAICTANVPTPPDAPLIKTFCPGWTFPLSRTPCNAVSPAIGTEAACSKVTLAGINAESRVLWFAKTDSHRPHDVWRAFDEMPVEWVN